MPRRRPVTVAGPARPAPPRRSRPPRSRRAILLAGAGFLAVLAWLAGTAFVGLLLDTERPDLVGYVLAFGVFVPVLAFGFVWFRRADDVPSAGTVVVAVAAVLLIGIGAGTGTPDVILLARGHPVTAVITGAIADTRRVTPADGVEGARLSHLMPDRLPVHSCICGSSDLSRLAMPVRICAAEIFARRSGGCDGSTYRAPRT